MFDTILLCGMVAAAIVAAMVIRPRKPAMPITPTHVGLVAVAIAFGSGVVWVSVNYVWPFLIYVRALS